MYIMVFAIDLFIFFYDIIPQQLVDLVSSSFRVRNAPLSALLGTIKRQTGSIGNKLARTCMPIKDKPV